MLDFFAVSARPRDEELQHWSGLGPENVLFVRFALDPRGIERHTHHLLVREGARPMGGGRRFLARILPARVVLTQRLAIDLGPQTTWF